MKTRNLLLFLLFLLFVPSLWAQRISDAEAAQIAASVLGKSVEKAQVRSQKKGATEPQEPQSFYSLYKGTDGTGFVLLSTDKRAPKIIGYGDGKADLDNLPPQLKYILEKQDSVLNTLPANVPVHSSWNQPAMKATKDGSGAGGGKLLKTANWGQGAPYNLYTPEIDGQHCPTGCVATAMAIVMKYYGWPNKGRGSHTYPWNGQDLSVDFANTSFDFTQMPDDFVEGEYTEGQSQEVAKLMKAAGVAVDMGYSQPESGAVDASR